MSEEERQKLEEAIKTIREVCKKQRNCDECVMRTVGGDHCSLIWGINSPEDWKLKSDELENDRLFR